MGELALEVIVDLTKYPIADIGSPSFGEMIDRIHTDLVINGSCDLPGFLLPGALDQILAPAGQLRPDAHRIEHLHDIEFSDVDPTTMDVGDVRRHRVRTAKGGVPYDLIPSTSAVRSLFESNVFSTLQQPGAGGVFEYVPMLRSESDRNDAGVHTLLGGSRVGIQRTAGVAGTLALFRGHWSPHRVTPIEGHRPRINAVLSYSRRPDHRLTPEGQRRFYGRSSS
jgi:hypothetical protein